MSTSDPLDAHASLNALSASLGLKVVKPYKVSASTQAWLLARAGQQVVLKSWKTPDAPAAGPAKTPYPVVAHRLLASMRGAYRRLVLPEYLYDGHDERIGSYVLLTHIEGRDFRDRWHYFKPDRHGGVKLDPVDIDLLLDLMTDLRGIETGDLLHEGLKSVTLPLAARTALRRLQEIRDKGLLPADVAGRLENALSSMPRFDDRTRSVIVSNGDFRFLNLLELTSGKTAIIDWDGAQASTFEIENGLAYNWLFLWNRPDLQERLLRGAEERFGLDHEVFRYVLLMRAVMQAQVCKEHPQQLLLHAGQAMGVLNDPGFPYSWP